MKGIKVMSENNNTDNLQTVDNEEAAALTETTQGSTDEAMAQASEEIKDEASAETEESTGVFGKGSENALGGTEYVGNFDDLLKSLGITPISQMDTDEIYADDGSEEIKLNIKQEDGYVPFSDETYLQSAKRDAREKQNKKFMQNFRVLSKKTEDSTILEAAPTGDGKGNVADRVELEEGEDIFEAVERAQSRKKKGVFHAKGKSADHILGKVNKRKKEEVLMKAKELSNVLQGKMAKQKIQLIALSVLGLIMIVFSFLPFLYSAEETNPLTFLFKNNARFYGILNVAFLLLAAAIGYDRLIEAGKSIKKVRPDSNTGLLILFLFVMIHQIALLIMGKSAAQGINLYNIYALFAVVVAILSENIKAKTALINISVVVKSGVLDSVHAVENKADSQMLSKGVSAKGKTLYCAQADTIRGLNGNLGSRPGENKFYNFLHIGVIVAGFAAGAVIMIRNRDTAMFFTAFTACICICGPTLCEFARTLYLYRENKNLASMHAAVTAFDGIKIMEKSSGVAMDASDIFTAKVSRFKAVRMSRMSVENSATLTAALLKETGSLIAECFDGYEETIDGDLPLAEDLQYEPRRGYRATVAGRDVIVGNRKTLIENEIQAPTKQEERSYAGNKCCMYVAVDGELTATFLVSYDVIPTLRKSAGYFSKSGLVLLLTTKDPCITEGLVSLKLSSDISTVKILEEDASALMEEYRLNRSMRQSNCLVCSKHKKSLFALVVGAKMLYEKDKLVLLMHTAGQILAFVMLLAGVIIGVPAFFNPYIIILLQAIWSALSILLVTKR